jgi:hypothetical protein
MEKIKVYAVGQFGIKTGFDPDVWMNYGKGIKRALFEKGKSYEVETEAGPKGKIITAVATHGTEVQKLNAAPVVAPVQTVQTPVASDVPTKNGKPLNSYEVAQEYRIRRSGLIQAAIQSPILTFAKNPDEAKKLLLELAELGLEWVEKK